MFFVSIYPPKLGKNYMSKVRVQNTLLLKTKSKILFDEYVDGTDNI